MSSGSPILPYGTNVIKRPYASLVCPAAVLIGVRIAPSAIALTRIRMGATSYAMLSINKRMPPLDVA